ncbi:TPA: hypothetical protein JI092_11890 [Acinetobacter baumannii]|nr:hypothetical protein [Acinetobacter baumannii]
MGEARKRGTFHERKSQALKNIKRGIITPPGKIHMGNSGFHLEQTLPSIEVLYLSLYWDEIVMPTGYIHVGVPFEDQLIETGVLSRPHSSNIKPVKSSLNADGSLNAIPHDLYAFGEVAKEKIGLNGEDWVIQHYSSNPVYVPEHRREQNSLRLRITNILPVPAETGEYSIHDLLEFKYRRRDQLSELHQSMDELLKRIYIEPIPAIKETEIKRFENAVAELDKPLIERFKIIKKSDWEINLSPDIPTLLEKAPAIVGSIITDAQLNFGFPIASSIAALSSMFSLSKTYGYTFNQFAKDDIKLEYISGAKSENIIP